MDEIKNYMISQATQLYKEIYPCRSKMELGDCFTTEGNLVLFWFNTSDESTHVLTASLR